VIDLPNQTTLANVREVRLVVDPAAGGDATGDFRIHSMVFQHVPSAQDLLSDGSLGSGDVTSLPNSPVGQLASSSPNSTLMRISASVFQLHFDLSAANSFAELSINFDPLNNGSSADLSGLSQIVFGLDSAQADRVKFEIEDASGNRATYYAQNVDVTRSYYKFLTSLVSSSVDLAHVKKIHFGVDTGSISSGNEIGDLRIEIGGLA
jgi:hypothetical protein